MLSVLLVVLAVAEAQLSSQNALYVLQTYSSPSSAPTCDQAHFLETAYEFPRKNANVALWCTQTPTSFLNYLWRFTNATSFTVQSFGNLDVNCTGPVLATQTSAMEQCIHLTGDNPAVSYKVSVQSGSCTDSSCGGTCCWGPTGNGCEKGASSACCCPDFQNACAAGSACICGGECPGTGCQCIGCGPTNEGYCTNQ